MYITDVVSPEENLDILRAFLAISADAVFCLILVEYLLYGAYARRKNAMTDGSYFVFIDISFSLYLLYMGGVDIYLALADVADLRRETTDFYFLDPVIFLFLVVNIGTIVLALRRIKARGAVPAGDAECPEGTVAPRSFEALGIDHGLTPRETEILDLLLRGMNNPQIAEDLSISIHTVKRHMNNIFRKLGVGNRYELILLIEKGGR